MSIAKNNKTDKKGYNEFYKDSMLNYGDSVEDFERNFEKQISPFYLGGSTKGYVRGLATQKLIQAANETGKNFNDLVVLDAGCGLGGLSVYLAIKGFKVIGIDISKEACVACENLAKKHAIQDACEFHATSLESLPLSDASVDFIIGHASLHHFIKYDEIPGEFRRVLKKGGRGFFADSFGENKLYSIFHDKEKMERLGDVSLTKDMIKNYFKDLNPVIIPSDWFVMLDKLNLRIFPSVAEPFLRKISKLYFWLDRKVPINSRIALALSGSICTTIEK